MPPHSRNHRLPTAADTPASTPASSLATPRAIAAQNRCRCSRRATAGRPGDRIAGRPVAAVAQSMGRPGSALDNAVIESWHSTLEFELRRLEHFTTRQAARAKVAAWIEDYNTTRKHSALGMRSPLA